MARTGLDPGVLARMQRDWDDRARRNARHFVNNAREDWDEDEFFRTGEVTVADHILSDMENICQGRDPRKMKILEIGCGIGRMTRDLARHFGRVYAVDISGEMIRQARIALAGLGNVRLFQNNGCDLSAVGRAQVDFAFSFIVFQHIPTLEVIESYAAEVFRVLRPGGLFKFQVQGGSLLEREPDDTWLGVTLSEDDAMKLARQTGFEARYRHGAGTRFFWLWFFKPPEETTRRRCPPVSGAWPNIVSSARRLLSGPGRP